MHFLHTLFRIYPFAALPAAFVLVELGIYFRRKRKPAQYTCFAVVGFLVLTSLLWVVFRGDLNSDRWVQFLFG